MAKWDSIQNITNVLSSAVPKVLNKRAHDTALSSSPFISKLFGEVPENASPFGFQGKNIKSVTGGYGEIRWRGDLPAPAAVTTQTTAATNNYDDDRFASNRFPLTHYALKFQIGVEELMYIDGDEAKTASYLNDEIQALLDGYFNTIATAFHATGDQAKAQVGSWRLAVDINDTVGTYLQIARADANNAGLRGNVDSAGGAITLARIQSMKNTIAGKNGKSDLILAGVANYTTIQGLVEGTYQPNNFSDNFVNRWGGEYVQVGRSTVCLDTYCSATNIAVLDTRFWTTQMAKKGFQAGDAIEDPGLVSIITMPTHLFIGIVCESPRTQGRIVTS